MWIKICGIRDVETAMAVAACRPDAIGLNFHDASPRVVTTSVAAEIVGRLPAGVEPVGLFVNRTADQIVATCANVDCGRSNYMATNRPTSWRRCHSTG